jgi:hypothetical protein
MCRGVELKAWALKNGKPAERIQQVGFKSGMQGFERNAKEPASNLLKLICFKTSTPPRPFSKCVGF